MIKTDTAIQVVGRWVMPVVILLCSGAAMQAFGQQEYEKVLLTDHVQEIKSFHDIEVSLTVEGASLQQIFNLLEQQMGLRFLYNKQVIEASRHRLNLDFPQAVAADVLTEVASQTGLSFRQINRIISVGVSKLREPVEAEIIVQDTEIVQGRVFDAQTGEALPGVNIVIQDTQQGTTTDPDGFFELAVENLEETLVFTYIGYETLEVPLEGRSELNVELAPSIIAGEELVVVGYGTMRHQDLTGSIARAEIDAFRTQPNTSIVESLQGSIPGLQVGQVDQAGQEPSLEIRDRTSLSGSQQPLIVVDGVIFRGNLIDLNPADVESIDILKDVSAAAVYGSQAANGVILITTTRAGISEKPVVRYSNKTTIQSPTRSIKPPSGSGTIDAFTEYLELIDIKNSRTEESGYLERDPAWNLNQLFRSPQESDAYNQGRYTNWYEELTSDVVQTYDHNLSLSTRTETSSLYMSVGYLDQTGYMINEGFNRTSARINAHNDVTDWLEIGFQSFIASTDYNDGPTPGTEQRFLSPVATSEDENGEMYPVVAGVDTNPLLIASGDQESSRLNLNGILYTEIEFPFLEGLSYRGNFSNNYRTTSQYLFESHAQNFQGRGSKLESKRYEWTIDNIVSYENLFDNIHRVDVTLLYGAESRDHQYTQAVSSIFSNQTLGYHNLQAGSSDQQQAYSGGWEETSLYQMARLFYGYDDKYQLTATVRRDGFSGFSEAYKFGVFPSLAVAWVLSEEPFMYDNVDWIDQLKFKVSYGSIGNRTIGRYQTLARVEDGFGYVNSSGESQYFLRINSLASPELKWETTTGFNFGLEFGMLNRRLSGTIDYYTNRSTNLLYEVDIPDITRYSTFPDNLGRLDNHGLEISLTSVNIKKQNLRWQSTVNYSRSRNELKELLGFDNDGDGREDDLVSEGLFIGESIDAIYDYTIDGIWQIGDDIPGYSDMGAYRVVDIDGDGEVTTDDRSIIGYTRPAYRFSINNQIDYKNWSLFVFINAAQGGSNRYMAIDDIKFGNWNASSDNRFRRVYPKELDFWTPENPDADYESPGIETTGFAGTRYSQRNFIRLKDVSLAYNVPQSLLSRFQIQNLRLYVSGKNLATITNWNGWDPETGEALTRGGRPVMRSFTMGIDISF